MDDIGTILYLVFTVIAIIFSIVKKNKQQKNSNAPTPSANPDSGDILDDIIPELKNIFQTQQSEPAPIPDPTPAPIQFIQPKPRVQNLTVKEKKMQLEKEANKISKERAEAKLTKQMLNPEETKHSESWFNAREAIIYSEIMKRPEY